jgi:DNA-directed RNA polymerase sigma subunit (sigma70/sigma32)
MSGSLSWITDDAWPSDEGWPYPDQDAATDVIDVMEDEADQDAVTDDDHISFLAAASHLLDDLGPLERQVVVGRFGLDGTSPRSMRELQHDLHLPRADLRTALGDGLAKIRGRIG